MSRFLVSGLINIETTLKIDHFPLNYQPVHYPFFGVRSTVSGVGYNVAKALTRLGDEAHLFSLVGSDLAGRMALESLKRDSVPGAHVLPSLLHTPQSVILYDGGGRRQIHVDLKDIQEREYPADPFLRTASDCDLAVLCNINFSRPFLAQARNLGIPVATDVHAIHDLDDAYNRDFMAAAGILFMSHENLPEAPESWARHVQERYGNEIIVIGLGPQGALLLVRGENEPQRMPAYSVRPVVNTIGAGDALFACFLHEYLLSRDPQLSLRKAQYFAAFKIGEAGAADGYLTANELNDMYEE